MNEGHNSTEVNQLGNKAVFRWYSAFCLYIINQYIHNVSVTIYIVGNMIIERSFVVLVTVDNKIDNNNKEKQNLFLDEALSTQRRRTIN